MAAAVVATHVEPELRDPKGLLHRIGRATDPMYFATISASDSALRNAGNRFDVPGGGVMYCATELETCYAETLARFRPTPKIREFVGAQDGVDPNFMVVGGVPADWRNRRLKVRVEVEEALPFLDVEDPDTVEYLNVVLAKELSDFDISNLDVGLLRGPDRRITRLVSSWAYAAQDENGSWQFSGIRYASRIDNRECWAIFAGTVVREAGRDTISRTDRALQGVADRFGLTVF